MAEYIERDEVIKMAGINKAVCQCIADLVDVKDFVNRVPTADVAPVIHGTWIHDINNLFGCSECLGRETMSHKRLKPYCPNCGAKMDGKDGKQE